MAKAQWKNGRNMQTLSMALRNRGENLKARALEALEKSIEEGGAYVQDNLEAAVTKTGLARAQGAPMVFDDGLGDADGRFPGRHETGNMVGAVGNEIRDRRSRRVIGVFGWWGQNYEDYFKAQDLGEGDIPAARALPQAYGRARENFRRRMRDVVRNRPVS